VCWVGGSRAGWAGKARASAGNRAPSPQIHSPILPIYPWRFFPPGAVAFSSPLRCAALRWFRCCMYFVAGMLNVRFGAGKTSTLVCFNPSGNFSRSDAITFNMPATKYVQRSRPVTAKMASSNVVNETEMGPLTPFLGGGGRILLLCYALLCSTLIRLATSHEGRLIAIFPFSARETSCRK
jgi:hypothetical protein